jgi:hypothetical protein
VILLPTLVFPGFGLMSNNAPCQWDQIGRIFAILGYFLTAQSICQKESKFLGPFLIKPIFYNFILISSFKTWFVVGVKRFQKLLDVDVLDFQIEL